MTTRTCCHLECSKPADVALVCNTQDPYDYTDACFDHIGHLCGSYLPNKEWGTYTVTVMPLEMW